MRKKETPKTLAKNKPAVPKDWPDDGDVQKLIREVMDKEDAESNLNGCRKTVTIEYRCFVAQGKRWDKCKHYVAKFLPPENDSMHGDCEFLWRIVNFDPDTGLLNNRLENCRCGNRDAEENECKTTLVYK